MKKETVEGSVLKLANQLAGAHGVEVMGVKLFGKGKGMILRVTLDKDGGVTLGDCERFSRELEALIETEGIIQEHYNLEVSSPGLDRPLSTVTDFNRNIGRLARVITKEKVDNQNFFIGRIISVFDKTITLSVDKKEMEIPFDNISKAKLEIEIK